MNARLPVEKSAAWPDDYPPATLPMLHRLTPAFDRLPLAEAMARCCLLFRNNAADDRYIGVISDPLDSNLQRWAEARAGDPRHLASGLCRRSRGVAKQAGGKHPAARFVRCNGAAPARVRTASRKPCQ